jgi:hypothetical protein
MKSTTKYPLIIESHPEDYKGYDFITLIRFNDENYLTIVDNVINKQIICYVLDLCAQAEINEEQVIDIANNWYANNRTNYPISIEFSKLELSGRLASLIRCFPIDYVTRVIGPLPEFEMGGATKVRKRKRKSIPKNMEFINKVKNKTFD